MWHRTILPKTICLGMVLACVVAGCSRSTTTGNGPGVTPGKAASSTFDRLLAKKHLPPFVTMESGLKYRILRDGKGNKPTPDDTVTLHYRGWLDNHKEFHDTEKSGRPETFSLAEVIPGWKEGLPRIGVGGIIELEVPPHLGYGHRSVSQTIPSNSTLHFLIQVVEVNQNPRPDPAVLDSPKKAG